MKKVLLVFAAIAVLMLATGPAKQVSAAENKKLWEGWVEELKKARDNFGKPATPAKKK